VTRVVFAWELGTFLGHVERDLAVAQRLRELGADVRFVVASLDTAEKLLAPAGFSFIPSPMLRRPSRRPRTPVNSSELLLDAGYDDADTVRAAVRGWLELWKLLAPDVIVNDFAPTALLSARIAGIPTLPMGPGFTVPPARDPMPAFRDDKPPEEAALRAADEKLLATINQVAESFGRPRFESVGARGRFRREQWSGRRLARVFAYLQSNVAGLEVILAALRQPAIETICVIPEARDALVKRFQNEQLRIFTEPLELGELLTGASAVVSYGSAGLVSSALQAGAPLLLFPKFLEQHLNSSRAARLGAAIMYPGMPTGPKVKAALGALLSNRKYRQAARAFAEKYQNYRHEPAINAVARAIMNRASRSGGT
jgi:UDP:flavonoid glycosyltransferase YjiC (YdhE family)